jgi:integrase
MARQPRPWHRKDRGYFVTINGKQHNLGKKQQEAWRKYHRLMAGREDLGEDPEVRKVIARYLDWSKSNHAEGTHNFYRIYGESFVAWISPDLRMSGLRKDHVLKWADTKFPKVTSSPSTRHGAVRAVQRAFNWAVEDAGIIRTNPIGKIKKDKPTRRETYIAVDQYHRVLGAIKDDAFRDIVEILRHTGCRPEEARKITSKEFNREKRCWELPAGFTAKTKKARSIPLNDHAYGLCCKWADRHPDGPMFLNRRGDPWRKQALVDRCRRLRAKLGFEFVPYTFRHVFATDALENGVDPITVARIMGHANLDMLNEYYEHIQQRSEHVRKSVEKATAHLKPALKVAG